MSALPAIREALQSMAPDLAIFGVTTMADERASVTGDRRVVLALLALFAAVTVLLAATGTWGIVAYAVPTAAASWGSAWPWAPTPRGSCAWWCAAAS